jgi:hypothetical protein
MFIIVILNTWGTHVRDEAGQEIHGLPVIHLQRPREALAARPKRRDPMVLPRVRAVMAIVLGEEVFAVVPGHHSHDRTCVTFVSRLWSMAARCVTFVSHLWSMAATCVTWPSFELQKEVKREYILMATERISNTVRTFLLNVSN